MVSSKPKKVINICYHREYSHHIIIFTQILTKKYLADLSARVLECDFPPRGNSEFDHTLVIKSVHLEEMVRTIHIK